MGAPKPLLHREVFEKHGETGTRFLFGGQSGEVGKAADAWLAEQQQLREEAAAATRDAREEETLSIARTAAETSKEAVRVAKHEKTTAIVAAVAAVVAAAAAIAPLVIQYVQANP